MSFSFFGFEKQHTYMWQYTDAVIYNKLYSRYWQYL